MDRAAWATATTNAPTIANTATATEERGGGRSSCGHGFDLYPTLHMQSQNGS